MELQDNDIAEIHISSQHVTYNVYNVSKSDSNHLNI